jgi:tripartite-type tricarboxylate transporter receptor subunit TctC
MIKRSRSLAHHHHALAGLAIAALLLLPASPAQAQKYPDHPIQLVIGFTPGGANDLLGRMLAPRLGEVLGTSVVVENRPGADGTVGDAFVARAAPDGYTLALGGLSGLVLSRYTYKELPFNVETDLVGVSTIVSGAKILAVKDSSPYKTLADYVSFAKANPGKMTWAVAGAGGEERLAYEMFKIATDTNIYLVVYKGAAEALIDVLGGRVDSLAPDFPATYGAVKQGQLHALAISTKVRSPVLPDIPTFAELGYPQFDEGNNWYSLVAPAHTPPAVLATLNAALHKVLADPDMQKQLAANGLEPMMQDSSDAFTSFLKEQLDSWGKVVHAAGIKPE